jgi:hypothetical protein
VRLLEQLPELTDSEGQLWTHNTSGEHALKFSDEYKSYNVLRRESFVVPDSPSFEVNDISSRQFYDMLIDDDNEVALVYHVRRDEDQSRIMIAGAVGNREEIDSLGEYASRMVVRELVVASDFRKKHIASYLLGKLSQDIPPTELVVDTAIIEVEDWIVPKLEQVGFRHNSAAGAPAMWMPAREASGYGRDLDDEKHIKRALEVMPVDWNGYWEFYPTTHPELHVFRERELAGVASVMNPTVKKRDGHNGIINDYELKNADGKVLEVARDITKSQALIALLNNYNLLDEDGRLKAA